MQHFYVFSTSFIFKVFVESDQQRIFMCWNIAEVKDEIILKNYYNFQSFFIFE